MNDQEEWRAVVGYEGLYEASDRGRVRSKRSGRFVGSKSGKYMMVWLVGHGRRIHRRVHVVVAAAFRGPRPSGQVVRHLDSNKLNNRLGNLIYGTVLDNRADDLRHGVYRSRLDPRKVTDIRRRAAAGERKPDLAAEFGMALSTIYNITARRSWGWVE